MNPDDQVTYELHEWPAEAREHLARLLQGWAHSWQGTALTVPASDMERTDDLVTEVEASIVLALDPDAEKLAYDLSDLQEHQIFTISGSLADEGIPHEFDGETGELVVHEADEEKVEVILDAVDFPDALPVDDGAEGDGDDDADVDPLAAQNAMSDLFVAADRLRKDARDPDGVLNLVAAAELAASLPLPYGFSDADWKAIVDGARGMADLIEADDTEDETIEEEADRLRTVLRPYV
jgi:hypothetical protein